MLSLEDGWVLPGRRNDRALWVERTISRREAGSDTGLSTARTSITARVSKLSNASVKQPSDSNGHAAARQ
jgi:hypothetical protein